VAKYWFEQVAGLAVDIDVASEFRYRRPVINDRSLFVAISQSGETADTLAALRYCKENGLTTAALVMRLTAELISVPRLITEALELDDGIAEVAKSLAPSRSAFYLGRGAQVPIAFEGALKIKEIAYIHAEGYAAGELKHGPIALIEEGTPVIVLAPMDDLYEKTISNLQEVASRGARVTLVTDAAGGEAGAAMADDLIQVPTSDPFIAPLLTTIAMQLLAYHTAVELGTDVDQPRSLNGAVKLHHNPDGASV